MRNFKNHYVNFLFRSNLIIPLDIQTSIAEVGDISPCVLVASDSLVTKVAFRKDISSMTSPVLEPIYHLVPLQTRYYLAQISGSDPFSNL